MENQLEKKIKNDMETATYRVILVASWWLAEKEGIY